MRLDMDDAVPARLLQLHHATGEDARPPCRLLRALLL
jgi:hypothetical protein